MLFCSFLAVRAFFSAGFLTDVGDTSLKSIVPGPEGLGVLIRDDMSRCIDDMSRCIISSVPTDTHVVFADVRFSSLARHRALAGPASGRILAYFSVQILPCPFGDG
jgi:hypothetical protein